MRQLGGDYRADVGFGELEGSASPWKSIRKDIGERLGQEIVGTGWWATPGELGHLVRDLGRGKGGSLDGATGEALVKWIWGPCRKSQAESGDRGPGDVGVGLEEDPEVMCSGPCAGEAGGEDCEKKEVSWDVLGVGLPEPSWDGWVSWGCTLTSEQV